MKTNRNISIFGNVLNWRSAAVLKTSRSIFETLRLVLRTQPRSKNRLSLTAIVTCLFLIATSLHAESGVVVHEWGTFTSVQGGDGTLVPWRAAQISELPEFVYDWSKPGLNRHPPMALLLGKGGLTALQRLETPVVYFYASSPVTADITVRFPKGTVTEWYPQATTIGPTGPIQGDTASATVNDSSSPESLIRWSDIRITPIMQQEGTKPPLPTSTRGSHYFAARETESTLIELGGDSTSAPKLEKEKFLFYRGAGSFATPLKVKTTDDGFVSVQNTGATPLTHLFLVQIRDGAGEFAQLYSLAPNAQHPWQQLASSKTAYPLPLETLRKQISLEMADALKSTGLFPKEAEAMVKTWSDSWFTEDGVRVFYILPRAWTDEILPLTMTPQPRELVRVMVGRAEIIPPSTQRELATEMTKADSGDDTAKKRLDASLKKLGRFAGAAMQLARARLAKAGDEPEALQVKN